MSALKLKRWLPWWSKIAAKIVLSRLPAGYALWQRLELFRHGYMDNTGYALGVFNAHVATAGLQGNLAGKTILEIGPGDSIASAIIAHAHGARAILVDVGSFAKSAPEAYAGLIKRLEAEGLKPPVISNCNILDELLSACDALYLTVGLDSFAVIKDASVDLIFSQAVLEHVHRHDFLATQRECARILRNDGVCSHRVDLRDHLGGGLNNLRFSEKVWESPLFVRSGFYTNRIQFNNMLMLFERSGFSTKVAELRRWERLPIKRRQLAPEFRTIPDQVLNVSGFDVLLKHA